jgi:hypothetical protein
MHSCPECYSGGNQRDVDDPYAALWCAVVLNAMHCSIKTNRQLKVTNKDRDEAREWFRSGDFTRLWEVLRTRGAVCASPQQALDGLEELWEKVDAKKKKRGAMNVLVQAGRDGLFRVTKALAADGPVPATEIMRVTGCTQGYLYDTLSTYVKRGELAAHKVTLDDDFATGPVTVMAYSLVEEEE